MKNNTFIKKKIKLYIPNYHGEYCFLTRSFGMAVRNEINLNKKDRDDNQYIISFDDSTLLIDDRFIYGLFFDSVKHLGIVKFGLKYNINFENIHEEFNREKLEKEYIQSYLNLGKMKKLKRDIY